MDKKEKKKFFAKAIKSLNKLIRNDNTTNEDLKQETSNAKPVVTNNGQEIKIPKGELAAVEEEADYLVGLGVDKDFYKEQINATYNNIAKRIDDGTFWLKQGQYADVITGVNKNIAKEKNIVFYDVDADVCVKFHDVEPQNKLITGNIEFSGDNAEKNLRRVIEVAKNYDVAYMPIGVPRHEMTLTKQGNKWAFVDQFGVEESTKEKEQIVNILAECIPAGHRWVGNAHQICQNTTGSCALTAQWLGNMVLDGEINLYDEIDFLNKKGIPMNQQLVDKGIADNQVDMMNRVIEIKKAMDRYDK